MWSSAVLLSRGDDAHMGSHRIRLLPAIPKAIIARNNKAKLCYGMLCMASTVPSIGCNQKVSFQPHTLPIHTVKGKWFLTLDPAWTYWVAMYQLQRLGASQFKRQG
eukprot:1020835-Amphidinium_carterae.1